MSEPTSSSDSFPTSGRVAPRELTPQEKEKNIARLRQVTQHFFTKAALTIVTSRVNLSPSFHSNSNQSREDKWFNLVIDESDDLQKELASWTRLSIGKRQLPPLFIEIYLDTAELARNQKLIVLDERGERWDVCDALDSADASSIYGRTRGSQKPTMVSLERWRVCIDNPTSESTQLQGESMANTYKKSVILFRSLYTRARLSPAWSFTQRIAKQPATLTSLRPSYRFTHEEPRSISKDPLNTALYPSPDRTTKRYDFTSVPSPAGDFSISVEYRVNCKFQVQDADALLSSKLTGMDTQRARPSRRELYSDDLPCAGRGKEPGSLPAEQRRYGGREDVGQAYGSMSTYHNAGGATGTSPITALRDAGAVQAGSPSNSSPKNNPTQRPLASSRSSYKSQDVPPQFQRRPSVSFQPFKAGSLSSSPAPISNMPPPPSPGTSATRTSSIASGLAHARNPSLTSRPPTAGRRPSAASNEIPLATPSPTSPKPPPMTRYSSSFGNRKSRFSSAGSNPRNEEDTSSGKASHSSSNQPGSGLLAEEPGGSSSSVNADDDNLSDFIKLLEAKKDLRSFNKSDEASRDASTRKTAAQLSRFRGLKDSHAAVTDSISSSTMMHRSSSSSSRQLSSVPPALVGASVSTSSSPGKPVSPHTPHTPAVPSRLSATALSVGSTEQSDRSRPRNDSTPETIIVQGPDARQSSQNRLRGSDAIDIPTSPRRYLEPRRPSSFTQRHRVLEDEENTRSASMPSDDRPDLSLNQLLAQHEPMRDATSNQQSAQPDLATLRRDHLRNASSINDDTDSPSPSTNQPGSSSSQHRSLRSRLGRTGGVSRGGSVSSFGGGSGSAERIRRFSATTNRPGTGAAPDEDEPLLFTMSELEQQSKRSLEDASGGTGK